jgi:hypothetical protein
MLRTQLQTTRPISSGRAVLVVAHPGHELSLTGWLAMMRPSVFVITDGSGQLGRSRLHSTTKVLLRTGARPGSIYGHVSDQEVYEAILRQDVGLFLRMAYDLAGWLILDGIDYVVGDSAEGYNPTHDVCRILVGGAVELATRLRGRPIGNYEYVVTGQRFDCMAGVAARSGSSSTMMHWSESSRLLMRIPSWPAKSKRPFSETGSKASGMNVSTRSTTE